MGAAVRYTVLFVAWVVTMATVFGGILLGPGIAGLLPVLVPAGMCTITSAHSWAFGDRVCNSCGRAYELDGNSVAATAAAAA
jgi:hypothetical protein